MHLIETAEHVLYHLESIDIENDEYLFWDSTGTGARVSVVRGKVADITLCDQQMSLREAFQKYAEANGLRVAVGKSPIDTWRDCQLHLPPKKTFWQRLFRKSKS